MLNPALKLKHKINNKSIKEYAFKNHKQGNCLINLDAIKEITNDELEMDCDRVYFKLSIGKKIHYFVSLLKK